LDGPSNSEYRNEPPIYTVFGRPGGETTYMSYQHWLDPPMQKLYEPNPGVPGVEFDSLVQPLLTPALVNAAAGTLALSTR